MREIRIDSPGVGNWIMERAHGYFTPGHDHSFSAHEAHEGSWRLLGGFACVGYFGASMTIHMAGADKRWFSRGLAAVTFDYAFNQLECRKLLAPVKSTDHDTIEMDLRAGWVVDVIIKDVLPDGDMVILSMTKDQCPWLKYLKYIPKAA
jgi:hypothetical protein